MPKDYSAVSYVTSEAYLYTGSEKNTILLQIARKQTTPLESLMTDDLASVRWFATSCAECSQLIAHVSRLNTTI